MGVHISAREESVAKLDSWWVGRNIEVHNATKLPNLACLHWSRPSLASVCLLHITPNIDSLTK